MNSSLTAGHQAPFRIGLVVNPLAGLGGSVALKGSDGQAAKALALGATPKALKRTAQAFAEVTEFNDQFEVYTGGAGLGADAFEQDLLQGRGFKVEVVYNASSDETSAEDSRALAQTLINDYQVDLLVFAGGDGTARDMFAVCDEHQPVLGIPAGVKIHSGVYAVSPRAAGKVMRHMLRGELTTVMHADVMDIDEDAFREGQVRARRFGEMLVPAELRYVQAVKMGGRESAELVLDDIVADVVERLEDDVLYVMGSGSTVAAVMADLQLPNTLLGVDVVLNGEVILADATAKQLQELLEQRQLPAELFITVIGGQGHIFGRGNQQLSAEVLRLIGKENIHILATKAKLQALRRQCLLVDTGDAELDDELCGLMRVITGYHDEVFVKVEAA